MKRVFLIVLDSVGIGALPDAADFGDVLADTMKSISRSGKFNIPNLISLGLSNIEGLSYLGTNSAPRAAYGRCAEVSAGKDTTTGHFEIAGLISKTAMPTFPDGFPDEAIEAFSCATGRGVICNKPYSGTKVIEDYGEEHLRTGALIVYTSADSVFQIAAHTDIVPIEELYGYCEAARKILVGELGVGRVIARPFAGTAGAFYRMAHRRDFSLEPHGATMLDELCAAGKSVISIGKINDIFAGKGINRVIASHGDRECMSAAFDMSGEDFEGLCFINLVDFDMNYGHRNDIDGYAAELSWFDALLPEFTAGLLEDDMLIITADHGCDPGDISTDHTREYTPLLVYGKNIAAAPLGTRSSFSDIAATVEEYFGIKGNIAGKSFLSSLEGKHEEYRG